MVAVKEAPVTVGVMPGPQSQFVLSASRHPAMFAGRRGGKTVASVIKAFLFCLNHPGAVGCLTAPTYVNIKDILIDTIWRVWGPGLPHVGPGQKWEIVGVPPSVIFDNGSRILLRAAEDPDKLRGLTLAFFGMDEAGSGNEHDTFKVLQPTLTQHGYPHQGWVTTTPTGQRSWLYYRWVKHELPDGGILPAHEYEIFRARTKDNFYLPPDLMASLEASFGANSKWAQQELEGEFVIFEGQAFPEFSYETHVKHPPMDVVWKRKICGLDYGEVRPTALVEVGQDSTGRCWAVREFYERRCNEARLLNVIGEWGSPKVYCDPSAKDFIEMLKRHGVNVRKAKSNSSAIRSSLVGSRIVGVAGKPGLFVSPECPNLIEELGSLAYAKPRGSEMLVDKWEQGADDHAFDALAYAVMEIDAGARGAPQLDVIVRRWGWS